MSNIVELQIPLNRVEGDLDIKVTIEDGVITETKSVGTLYRGFENILKGRDPLDALVITPRVCGICSVSHLQAAVKALEDAYGITPPIQAVRLRNLSIMCENIQSDLKQVFLMFMADFASSYYEKYNFYKVAKKNYEPFHGKIAKSVLDATKEIIKVIAYIGGQWPHTSHMVPGGLSVMADDLDVLRIRYLIIKLKEWFEKEILKISIDEFLAIDSYESLKEFVKENPKSHVSIFTNIAKETDLFKIGKTGYGFINYGSIDREDGGFVVPRGYNDNTFLYDLDISSITEDVSYSWYDGSVENPMQSKTVPNINKKNGYTFAKAPRYNGKVVQTGPLGEELAMGNELFKDLYEKFGDSVYVRELARMLRPIRYISLMESEIEDVIKNIKEPIYEKPEIKKSGQGVGLTHAARGALGHWVEIENGKIANYQIISPTTWNGSPRDKDGNLGPWEKALTGLKIKDINNPMEMGHIIRSFDPCLVCTVHFLGAKGERVLLRF